MEKFQATLDPRKQELLEARFLGARVSFFLLLYMWESVVFYKIFDRGLKLGRRLEVANSFRIFNPIGIMKIFNVLLIRELISIR